MFLSVQGLEAASLGDWLSKMGCDAVSASGPTEAAAGATPPAAAAAASSGAKVALPTLAASPSRASATPSQPVM